MLRFESVVNQLIDDLLLNVTQDVIGNPFQYLVDKLTCAAVYLAQGDELQLYVQSVEYEDDPVKFKDAVNQKQVTIINGTVLIPLIINRSLVGLCLWRTHTCMDPTDLERLQGVLSLIAGHIVLEKKEKQKEEEQRTIGKFEELTGLASKLVSASTSNDMGFLKELLKVALAQITEADYGSISIVEGDEWRFVDAVGHDAEVLQSLPLKKEYLIDIHQIEDHEVDGPVHIGIIHSYDNLHLSTMPHDIYEPFFRASKPMKSSMLIEYILDNEILGTISIDIDKHSLKEFSSHSYRLFKAIGNLAFSFISFLRFAEKEKEAKREIEQWNVQLESLVEERTAQLSQANHKMISSMNYAKRIQEAILPSSSLLSKTFIESCLIWMPRDIVGGDFYWLKTFDEQTFVAVGDCTGHGVPGALMTMVSISLLNQVVEMEGIREPARIIKRLNELLKRTLGQDSTCGITDDGLDIGICLVKGKETISYAGAKSSLYASADGQLQIYKGNKKSVGYRRTSLDYEFDQVEISLQSNQVFYLLTDGYADQNGGEKDFSFGRKQLEQLIQFSTELPLAKQKEVFLKELQSYMGDESQRDDITLLAFKI
ncbi:SpoIIE family protein phosphatase [Ammoniphilus sp. YIM 78166]|uniref:SpoIIE family protein phosphatase n=1 Tax=Ammoniphilus sp. YIM 78166 TaxID=1644106 RepID=UPI00106F5D1E|nr:SpoIIE family protein phosphatase [Ammoniphilus sp. YIM 78166]